MYASLFYSYVWLFLYLLHAESTSEHLKSPNFLGKHAPRPRGGGPIVPTRLASFPGLHAQHLLLEATTRCPGYSTGPIEAVLVNFSFLRPWY